MKKKFIFISAYLLICLLLINVNIINVKSQPEQNPYSHENELIISNFKKTIEKLSPTGDLDINFLSELMICSENIISIAKNQIKFGDNINVKNLSKSIIKKQTKSLLVIKELKVNLEKNPTINKDVEKEYIATYKEIINNFITQLESINSTVNIDNDFLHEINAYHNLVKYLVNNILKYTKNEDIKNLCNEIIKAIVYEESRVKDLLIEINS